ncbi:barstar family protein [Streptomyces chattanoogensis]
MDEDGSLREVVWGRDLPLRFALVSEEWDGEQTVWARCVDADGLFMDPGAFREQLTLLGCAPTGRLLKAAERCARHAPVPFGELHLIVSDLDAEMPYTDDYWELDDVVVIDSRPSAEDPTRLDLVVECVITDEPLSYRKEPARTDVILLNGTSGGPLGRCRRVDNLYGDRPASARRPVRLVGCEPSPSLVRRMVHPRRGGDELELWLLDRTGRPTPVRERITVEIDECRPSTLGGALIDVTLNDELLRRMPSPPAARPVWDAWYEGPPRERNAWARFPTEGRSEWLQFTEVCLGPEEPGAVCELDGRYATDIPGLHCAIGEAVGGPGYRWHQCWNALRGCQCGGEASWVPFTLVWHDADVARRALAGVSVDTDGELSYFDAAVSFLERMGVTVALR